MTEDHSNKLSDTIHKVVPTPPTALARRWIRYLVGFSVSVGVGVAPYLGMLDVPLFKPLLNLMPNSLHSSLFPPSAALMGIVAVVTEWYAGERINQKQLRRVFVRSLVASVLFLVILIVAHTLVVVQVPYYGGKDSAAFVVGFTRPDRPPCTAEMSDAECIKNVTFDESAISSYWGDRQVQIAKLSLILPYLAMTSSFAVLIALLLIRDKNRK